MKPGARPVPSLWGFGANTTLFNVFNAALLEPLPYPDPMRLFHVWNRGHKSTHFQKSLWLPLKRRGAGSCAGVPEAEAFKVLERFLCYYRRKAAMS